MDLGIGYKSVLLGEVLLTAEPSDAEKQQLLQRLQNEGFDVIDNRRSRIVEQIKQLVLKRIAGGLDEASDNLSQYLTQHLHLEYSYLSNLFSSVESLTIEKFYIVQKIEKVKELLVYDELSLSEIAYRLGYSSVQHLSNQFKKVTGLTPSHFKRIGAQRRNPLDQVQ
jgi:AraC-like DNA-binding protein